MFVNNNIEKTVKYDALKISDKSSELLTFCAIESEITSIDIALAFAIATMASASPG